MPHTVYQRINSPVLTPVRVVGLLLTFAASLLSGPSASPNIIMVLVDDLGWQELGCYANTFNATPRLDRLASEGVRFTNAYSSAPVCSPARSTLMTGQLPVQTGITDYVDEAYSEFLDPERFTSIARTLKNAGYHTGIIGKWHLDGDLNSDRGTPARNGFDEVILTATRRVGGGDYRFPYGHIPDATQRLFPAENLVDRMNLEAVEFIERNRDVPFFLYLSHYAVHTTLDAPDSLVALFNARRETPGTATSPVRNPFLAAMLRQVDNGVGMIVDKLVEHGLDSTTVVIFTSDNGGDGTVTDNGALRDAKSSLYEGGLRIPFIAWQPGTFRAGCVCRTPVNLADFYPTAAALTGASLPSGQSMSGTDLTPLCTQSGPIPARTMLWHYPRIAPHFLGGRSGGALLQDGFKLIRYYDTDKLELYDLSADSIEALDRAAHEPELTRSLAAQLHAQLTGHLTGITFDEDFTDRVPADWKTFGGTWSAAAQSYSNTAGDGIKAITHRKYYTDLVCQARVTVSGGAGNAGVVLRASNCAVGTNAYRGYYAGVNAHTGMVTFGRSDNDAWTLLGQAPHPVDSGAPHLLRVVSRGARFTVFVDDTSLPLITVVDSTYDGGLIGLRSHKIAATWDDVFAMGIAADQGTGAHMRIDAAAHSSAGSFPPARLIGPTSRSLSVPGATLARSRDLTFRLFDVQGKKVEASWTCTRSGHGLTLRLSAPVPSGHYILYIAGNGIAERVRLLVL